MAEICQKGHTEQTTLYEHVCIVLYCIIPCWFTMDSTRNNTPFGFQRSWLPSGTLDITSSERRLFTPTQTQTLANIKPLLSDTRHNTTLGQLSHITMCVSRHRVSSILLHKALAWGTKK